MQEKLQDAITLVGIIKKENNMETNNSRALAKILGRKLLPQNGNNRNPKYKYGYAIRVDGRVYEISRTKERRDEIVPLLKQLYTNAEIIIERRRIYV